MRKRIVALGTLLLLTIALHGQEAPRPDWARIEDETMRHFQALVRMDTSDPPGNEQPAADYLKQLFEKEGIPVQTFTLEPKRTNVVARLKGNGRKRPLLIMGHLDVVNVDPSKWTHPPFSATRDGGYVYGRGTTDDKDNVTAGVMTLLTLKRLNVPLDRDVILLTEAGEEGTTRVGIEFMVNQHFDAIDAEYCLAETGGVTRVGGVVKYGTIQANEKIPRAVELTARGISGHASVPLQTNALLHLGGALERLGGWRPPVRLNETTRAYFTRLAAITTGEESARYRDVLVPAKASAVDQYFRASDPSKAALLHATATPTMISAGYRINVIPSEAKATVDVRTLPDDNLDELIASMRKAVNDSTVSVEWAPRDTRPPGATRLDTDAFKVLEAAMTKNYSTTTLPIMSTGATDMAFVRGKGVQCYGIGPAIDQEDAPKGFGAHSDQERILESELHRFVRFNWDVVNGIAGAK